MSETKHEYTLEELRGLPEAIRQGRELQSELEKVNIYYDGSRALTYNCLFNFVMGNRGAGKTYWSKGWCIKGFLKNGDEFIYLRRYEEELKNIAKFFDDISQDFPETKFEVRGRKFYINDIYAGCAMELSKAKIAKSTPFPKVKRIVFDEFILDKGVYHYLPDEVVAFLEFYETVARMRDVTVFFLSNMISAYNPYFVYFNIEPGQNEFKRTKSDILLQMVANADFIAKKKETRFGRMITGTAYGDYAIENKALRDNNNFIQKKSQSATYIMTLSFKGGTYGVWVDVNVGRIWCSKDVDPSFKMVYAFSTDDHTPNTLLIKRVAPTHQFKMLIQNFRDGNVFYENQKIKGAMMELFTLLIG